MKKTLSMIMALAMLLSVLSFCSVLAEPEKRVLTIGSRWGEGEKFYNSEAFQKYLDEIGCEIKFTYYEEEPFAALLAGGDLPDILIAKNIITNVLSNKLALNIQPYLEEYAPNLLKGVAGEAMRISAELMGDGKGGIYIIPPCLGVHQPNPGAQVPQRGYIVRWDYYKELGCPEINSEEDYMNVLIQMQANHPTAEDGSPTYAFGFRSGDVGYRGAFVTNDRNPGLNHWALYQYKSDIINNDVWDGYLDPEMSAYYTDMAFINMIYRTAPDLLDVDAFTMTGDEYNAKVAKGQYMGIKQTNDRLYNAEVAKNPDTLADYVVVPTPKTTNYTNLTMPLGNMPSRFAFISAKSQNYDLALKFFNFVYDEDFNRLAYSGEQGVTWDYDENGVPHLFEEALADRRNGGEYWTMAHQGGKEYGFRITYLSGFNPGVRHSDGYPVDLSFNRESAIKLMDNVDRDMCEFYGQDYILDVYAAVQRDFRNDLGECIASCMVDIPSEKLRIIQACQDIFEVGKATLTFCETQEEYDAAVKELQAEIRATGEEEVFAWYKEQWDAIKDIFNSTREGNAAAIGLTLYPTTAE